MTNCTMHLEIYTFEKYCDLQTVVTGNVAIRYIACDFFLLMFSNYGSYLVSFPRYSMSKNAVTLKSG